MNILSLFDGMSCGQLALNRAGIKYDKYFASEIDKFAISVTMANFPDTIQLGSVTKVNGYDLPKIDLLIGGSPCQSFSFAGKRNGMTTIDKQDVLSLDHYLELKSEGYIFEGQSYLFWEFMRLLTEVKPKYFLLENVMMSQEWEKVLTKAIGVNPILIDSALVSAQSRRRMYWTNIGMQPGGLFGYPESIIKQPSDRKIMLKDILQNNPNPKFYLSNKTIDKISRYNNAEKCFNINDKSLCLAAGYNKQGRDNQFICQPIETKYFLSEKLVNYFKQNSIKMREKGNGFKFEPLNEGKKSNSLTTKSGVRMEGNYIVHNTQKRDPNRPSVKKNKNAGGSGPLSRNDGKTYCLDTKQSNAIEIVSGTLRTHKDGNGFREIKSGKGGTIPARARQDGSGQNVVKINSNIRRLTPIECERLQTVPDNYTNYVSDSQRYKMLGNGWTIDVISHIFSYL